MQDLRASPDWRTVDGLLLAFSGALPILARWGTDSLTSSPHFYLLVPIILLRLFLFHTYQLYDFEYHNGYFDIVYTTAGVMAASGILEVMALFGADYYYYRQGSPLWGWISFRIPVYEVMLAFLLTAGWRCAFIYYAYHVKKLKTRLLIVGAGGVGRTLGEEISEHAALVYAVVGYVDEPPRAGEPEVLGTLQDLENVIREHNVDEILVTSHRDHLVEILDKCTASSTRVRLLPGFNEVVLGQMQISQIAGLPLVVLDAFARQNWQTSLKRSVDTIASAVSLVLLSPVLLLVGLAVRLDSPGPILFRQVRVGKGGKHFKVIKFRTMIQDAEPDGAPVLSSKHDPRVTRVGKFLRRTALDELPQLWNVLKGEMTLVGPRPERPQFVEEFSREFPSYPLRHVVRPGMTGLAQIYGRYDSAAEHKLRYDLAYINNLSFFLDLRILLKTIRKTLTGSRAR
jgi:exopolysaccharide biosynthesis polyprenyl glycosylphosphotransferase